MPISVVSPGNGSLNINVVVGVEFPAISVNYPVDLSGATVTLKSVPDGQLDLTPLGFSVTDGVTTITIALTAAETTALGVTSFKYVLEYVHGGDPILIFGGTVTASYT